MKSLLLFFIIFTIFSSCKKEEKKEEPSTNKFTVGGKTYQMVSEYNGSIYATIDCLTFGSNGRILNNKIAGTKILLVADNSEATFPRLVLKLELFGEDKGKYEGFNSMCSDLKMKSPGLLQSSDGSQFAFISEGIFDIVKKEKNKISGTFRLKIKYDKDFLSDSLIIGEFNDIAVK